MLVLSWMAAHLAYGVTLVMVLIPAQRVGARFYRLNLGIASALLAVALLVEQFSKSNLKRLLVLDSVLQPFHLSWLCFLLCLLIVILAGWGVGRAWFQLLLVSAAASAAVAMLTEALALSHDVGQVESGALAYLFAFFSSAILLGTVLVGMNLGHWYLVVLDMPFRYLRNFTFLFGLAVILKLLALVTALYWFGRQFPDAVSSTLTNFTSGNALFFWTRVAVGIVIPMMLAVMIWMTVKIRSNQSATGLLYVAVVFVLFGELFAKYLLAISRLPL